MIINDVIADNVGKLYKTYGNRTLLQILPSLNFTLRNREVFSVNNPKYYTMYAYDKQKWSNKNFLSSPEFDHTKFLPNRYFSGTAFYGGVLHDHYGHFIIETLSRLSNYEHNSSIIWGTWLHRLCPWQYEILYHLGIKNNFFFNTNRLYLEHLIIKDREFIIDDKFTEKYNKFLAIFDDSSDEYKNQKIWLSRGLVAHRRGYWNEMQIEILLRREGWLIINPEQLSVKKQASLFNSAEIIAGVQGSAFFAVLLAKYRSANIKTIVRPLSYDALYDRIARATGINQEFINHEFMDLPQGRVLIPDQIMSFLKK